MTVAERLRELIEEHHMRPAEATRELGISGSSFTDWKTGKGSPSLDILIKFSDYFNVSLDYLVRGEEHKTVFEKNSLELSNSRERKLMEQYRKLPVELQDKLLIYADGMLAALPFDDDFQQKRLQA